MFLMKLIKTPRNYNFLLFLINTYTWMVFITKSNSILFPSKAAKFVYGSKPSVDTFNLCIYDRPFIGNDGDCCRSIVFIFFIVGAFSCNRSTDTDHVIANHT